MSTAHPEQFAASSGMAMIQGAHAAQRSLVSAGREQAAAWHDGRTRECEGLHTEHTTAGREMLANAARAMAQFHVDAAMAIRKLTD